MPRGLSWDEYATVWAGLHGGADPRRARPAVTRWLRVGYVLAKAAAKLRVPPGGVTALGIVACLFVPVMAVRGAGWALLAAGFVALAAVADTVDGALAVLTDHTTRLGYVYDSLADRISEACWLAGFYLVGVSGPVVVAVGAVSWLHEYTRSRANAAGMTEIGALTVGERPTRVVLAFLGFALVGVTGGTNSGVASVCVGIWGVLAVIGFGQLFAAVHRALAGKPWPSWRRGGTPLAEAVARRVSVPDTGADYAAYPSADPIAALEFDLDPALREELSQLDELPGSTAVYVSSSAAEHTGRHADTDPPEPAVEPAATTPGRHASPDDESDNGPGGLFR